MNVTTDKPFDVAKLQENIRQFGELLGEVIKEHKIVGVAAGSLFVFKGKYKAVLINYPNKDEKEKFAASEAATRKTNDILTEMKLI